MAEKRFNILFLAWVISCVATLGSLFFSEIMNYVPCSLCWYQRIFMYPLSIILLIGLFPVDKKLTSYALPLAGIGWGFSVYHNLLQWKIIPETMSPCKSGIPCSASYINWMDFISIPLLSLISFSLILILLFLFKKYSTGDQENV